MAGRELNKQESGSGVNSLQGKIFLKGGDLPKSDLTSRTSIRTRSKCASNSLCLTLLEMMQAIKGSEATSDNPNYVE